MPEYFYVKDLLGMKYNIVAGPMQDCIVSKIAQTLNLNKQTLRKCLIESLDMAYIENIPARYAAWSESKSRDKTKLPMGLLFTLYLPLLPNEIKEINLIQSEFEDEIKSTSFDEAVINGNRKIAELIKKWA